MAFDGVTIASIVQELNEKILEGRIYKIAQPEKDELILTLREQIALLEARNEQLSFQLNRLSDIIKKG